jgi:fumarylacetoacetase
MTGRRGDIQKWEYQPLGPFLAKNFATTISPYIVTLEALEPFRCPAYKRPDGDPRPLPYLYSEQDQSRGGFDIALEVWLQSAEMQKRGMSPVRISKSNAFKEMYWTIAQMLTHHASNGCNPPARRPDGKRNGLRPRTGRARVPAGIDVAGKWAGWEAAAAEGDRVAERGDADVSRDGDEVIFKGYCEKEGFRMIGFGECRGRVAAAKG